MKRAWLFVVLLLPLPALARPDEWAKPIPNDTLPNLHQVSPTIYRSAQPEAGSQEALTELGIRSVISLRFNPDRAELLPEITRIHAPIESWDVDHDEVMRALRALIDPENQPVLLHCRHGADRTGTVIAAYRIVVEDWTAEAAIEEMRNGGYNYHAIWTNMLRYLRKLDVAAARAELGMGTPEK
ncbi:MAG: tyrosine-protein phosphatase [Ahniella sp.]|nr:tyrosine-protein phosphatase [Ahniella sp.]